MTARLSPEAEGDILDIVSWYRAEEPTLGDRFLTAVRSTVQTITNYPLAFREVEPGMRQVSLPRFPHLLYYSPEREHLVILRVLHMRRRPGEQKIR